MSNPRLLQYTQNLLSTHSLSPQKHMGQNFLIDESVVERIANPDFFQNVSTIVEVGTGLGALTARLAQCAPQIITVEKSKQLYKITSAELGDITNVTFVHNDILRYIPPSEPYALVGTIPYYLTGHLFRTFLSKHSNTPTTILCVIQKQVAEKIVSSAPHHSLLSISVQLYGTPTINAIIPQNAFYPQPTIQSALLHLPNIRKPDVCEKTFFQLVKCGFSHPRKTLWNNLSPLFSNTAHKTSFFQSAHLSQTTRAQELTLDEWKSLVALYQPCV